MLSPGQWPEGVTANVRADVEEARVRGYATSHDEVIPTLRAVAVPLRVPGRPAAAIGVVYVSSTLEPAVIGARLQRSADAIREALGG